MMSADNQAASPVEGAPLPSSDVAPADWATTIDRLMSLARGAAEKFDFQQAIEYLHSAEEIWDSKGMPEYSLDRRIEVHREAGRAYASLGKLDQAIDEYQKILKYCRDSSKPAVKSETFTQIAQLLSKQGDHERALGYLQRAIASYRRLDDKIGMCRALRNLGVIYVELGEFEEAQTTYTEAIALASVAGDQVLYADLVNNLGAIMNMRGNAARALDLYRESLEIYLSHQEIRKSAYTGNNIAITLLEQGQHGEAFEYFKRAGEIAQNIKDASLALIVNINLADLHLKRGQVPQAKEHCHLAEQQLAEANLRNGHAVEVKKISGKIAIAENRLTAAVSSLTEALVIAKEIGAQFQEADVLMERGMLMRSQGKHFEAITDLEACYRVYTTVKAEGRREKTEELINSIERLYLEIFASMSRDIDRKDQSTKGHSDRVASLALLLAREVGLRGGQLKTIVAGALLHDIGKIRIDDAVLKKPGRLTDEEFAQIQRHPQYGIELLEGKEFPWDIRPLILYHHERINGTGYPSKLQGEDIPLGARIICIADVFDALTSDRVYRAAFPTEKALDIMRKESGTTFDSVLLSRFIRMIDQGKADLVINSRTDADEMYGIWSRCMAEEPETVNAPAAQAPA